MWGFVRLCAANLVVFLGTGIEARALSPQPEIDFDLTELLAPSTHELQKVLERYASDRDGLRRHYPVDMSARRIERFRTFYRSWQASLAKLDFPSLSLEAQIDALLLDNQLRYELRKLDWEDQRGREAAPLLPFAASLIELEDARRRMEPVAAAAAARRLADVVKQVQETRNGLAEKLDAGPNPPPEPRLSVANRAAGRLDELLRTLKGWYEFYEGYDPEFTWWVRKPYEEASRELEKYADFLRKRIVGVKEDEDEPIVGDPIGREALLSELAHEIIPYTPEELIDIANHQFAWCDREMLRASQELGFGDEWRKALEHVKSLHVKPGEQPTLIRDLALEAVDFLDKRNLLTIPPLCRETWRMNMMSPERQKVSPYFTGGEIISVSFPTDEMTHTEKLMSMRGNNVHFSRATVHHELIPGHHLQQFMTERYRPHRRIFRTPFWGEGWAFYWEMLLWDLDFPKSAENRVGMLFWRMHRCARIIFSLSFHLEKMSPAEAIEFLVERVGHERNNATAEVRRSVSGDYSSLYQCAYMLGGLQIRALYQELVETEKMSAREFHDAVLRENSIPIEMIRAHLTKQPLTREFSSQWRFAD